MGERKVGHVKEVARDCGLPLIILGESSGARMPDVMGAAGMATLGGPTRFLRRRDSPWISAVLGPAYGSAAWHACAADVNIMRKGAVMAVSSPKLVELATRAHVDPETLGGWRVHAEVTGFADIVVDSDGEALDQIKGVLEYFPSNRQELPPIRPVPDGSGLTDPHFNNVSCYP